MDSYSTILNSGPIPLTYSEYLDFVNNLVNPEEKQIHTNIHTYTRTLL